MYSQKQKKDQYFLLRYSSEASTARRFINFFMNKSTVNSIIIGPCGHGKTSLMNILCGTVYQANQQYNSATRDIQANHCQYEYAAPFIIIDTPGSTSMQNKYMHAAYIRQALTFQQLNTIFILVKFDSRFQVIYKSIVIQSKMVQKYKDKIVYVITHFDHAENPKEFVLFFNNSLKSKKIYNQVIYLSNKFYDQKKICDTFYNIAQGMTQQKLKISNQQFYKNFSIKLSEQQMQLLQDQSKQYIDKMRDIAEQYIELVKSLPNSPEKEAIIQDLAVQLKIQLRKQVDLFTKHMATLDQTQCIYQFYYTIQAEVQSLDHKFQTQVITQRTGGLIHHKATGAKTDIRDLIKQCPQCGLIWMRIQSCPNTHCGARPSCFFDIFTQSNFQYKVKRRFGKLQIIKQPFTNTKENISNIQKGKSVGCGQVMNFETLPRLLNVDNILKEWYKVTTIQEVIAQFQSDQQIDKTRLQIEYKARISAQQSMKSFKS